MHLKAQTDGQYNFIAVKFIVKSQEELMSRKGENIYKRKDGRWEGRYMKGVAAGGKTIYGSCYGKTYREAKEKLERCKLQVLTGKRKNKASAFRLFGSYCDEWLAVNKSAIKESTAAKYTVALNNHIKPYFGEYSPQLITTEMTADFVDELLTNKKLSPKTAKDIAIILKSILKYISKQNSGIALIDVAMPKYTPKEIRVLSQEEQRKFLKYLISNMDIYKFGVLFSLMTGLRIGEVCALRVSDVSLTERVVTVRETMQRIKNLDGDGAKTKIVFTSPKSDTSARVVPLTNTAYALCKEKVVNAAPNAFLLTGSETKFIEPRILQSRIKKYGKDCGIDDLHFHVLRHTFATRCVEVGFEIKTLSEVLGHSSPRITLERYVHSSIDFKRENMAKLEAVGL